MDKKWHYVFSTLFLIVVIPLMIVKPEITIFGVKFGTTDLIILSLIASMIENVTYWFEEIEEKIENKQ